jgi:hypothetical protein
VQAFQKALGLKEAHWIDGAMTNDLYDKEEYVGPAVAKLTEFFTKNLAPSTLPARSVRLIGPSQAAPCPPPAGAIIALNGHRWLNSRQGSRYPKALVCVVTMQCQARAEWIICALRSHWTDAALRRSDSALWALRAGMGYSGQILRVTSICRRA